MDSPNVIMKEMISFAPLRAMTQIISLERFFRNTTYLVQATSSSNRANSAIIGKRGVPNPVTGSQPWVAFQLAYGTKALGNSELVPQWQPREPPSVISVNAVRPML